MLVDNMLVDNININNFGATLVDKIIGTANFILESEWLKHSHKPIVFNKRNEYIKVYCIFAVKADNKNLLEEKKSHFLKKIEECTIKFSDIDFYFDAYMMSKNNDYIGIDIYDNLHTEKIEVIFFTEHKYKQEVIETLNRISSKTINIAGNLETPAIVEITPTMDLIDLTITGLGDTFKIKNLKANQKVIVDAENGLVTMNGSNKYGDFDGWEFPELKPGSNTITVSNTNCTVNIKYKPRWI